MSNNNVSNRQKLVFGCNRFIRQASENKTPFTLWLNASYYKLQIINK